MKKVHSPSRRQLYGLLFLVVVLVAATVYYAIVGSDAVRLSVGESSLAVSGPNDYSFNLPFSEIAAMELVADVDYGNCTEGFQTHSCYCGVWSNSLWQEFTLCVQSKLHTVVALTKTDGSIYVLNFESDDATESFYHAFADFLSTKGYQCQSLRSNCCGGFLPAIHRLQLEAPAALAHILPD